MELPSRARGDERLPPGEMLDIRRRLRHVARQHDLASVVACAFDHRTRMLPFIWADFRMAPAGARAIGAAMVDSGFPKTRVVLQQWNKNVRPTRMRLDGRIPDLLMISSMRLHTAEAHALIRDACRIDARQRPLIIAGGPMSVYEPWAVFGTDADDPWGADVAVTGEEYVMLNLLEVLCSMRAEGEPIRSAFLRARDAGALDDVPGLVYPRTDRHGVAQELVDTGIQRLVGDLDELPHAVLGYDLLEPPSTRSNLGPHALPPGRVRKHCRVASILLTQGCKFRCNYCPIPAYHQRQFRAKSGERIANEFDRIYHKYGIRVFFGADDNFFNSKERTLEICETLARKVDAGSRSHRKVLWATEATIHDTLRLKEHLPVVSKAGMFALWIGVEDMTATLVKKGQDEDKTIAAFRLLRDNGIFPMPMMMHHDSQPLVTWRSNYGLLNQLRRLRQAGAINMQVLMLNPAVGSKSYDEMYASGLTFESVNGEPLTPRHMDGNYVTSSRHRRPWVKQLNLLLAYLYFFNPVRLLIALAFSKSRIGERPATRRRRGWPGFRRRITSKLGWHLADAGMQLFGMWGLAHTARRTLPWCWNLLTGRIRRESKVPASPVPMRSVQGEEASHALPGTPTPDFVSLGSLTAKRPTGETRKAA